MKNNELAEIVKEVWEDRDKNFNKLFDACWSTVYYLAYKKLSNKYDAEDVSQEVMVYIYNHINELKSAEAFNRWMFKIVFGKCNDYLSKRLRLREVSEEQSLDQPLVTTAINQEAYMDASENNAYLLSTINKLSDKQKDVFLLHYYGEMTANQISDVLDCSVEAVKNRLYQARKFLKVYWEKDNAMYSFTALPLLLAIFTAEESTVCGAEIGRHIWEQMETHLINIQQVELEKKSDNRKQPENIKKRLIANQKGLIGGITAVVICALIVLMTTSAQQNRLKNDSLLNNNPEEIPVTTVKSSQPQGEEAEDKQEHFNPVVSEQPNIDDPDLHVAPVDESIPMLSTAPDNEPRQTAKVQVEGPNIRPYPTKKPQLIRTSNILVYKCGEQVTTEQVLSDGGVSAVDGHSVSLDVEIIDWQNINWQNPGIYGIYVEAFDQYGNTTGRKAISIEVKP